MTKTIRIRAAETGDAPSIIAVRYDAIRTIDPQYYAPDLLEEWAGAAERRIRILLASDADIRIVAETGGKIAGYGELVTGKNLLGACYVGHSSGRKGVGRAIMAELENIARAKGLEYLHLESSSNAEIFYLRCGYRVIERGSHSMHNGKTMGCTMMRKEL